MPGCRRPLRAVSAMKEGGSGPRAFRTLPRSQVGRASLPAVPIWVCALRARRDGHAWNAIPASVASVREQPHDGAGAGSACEARGGSGGGNAGPPRLGPRAKPEFELLRRKGRAEVVALCAVAAARRERPPDLLCLDALDEHFEAEVSPEVDRRAEDGGVVWSCRPLPQETIPRSSAGEREVAGAEVVRARAAPRASSAPRLQRVASGSSRRRRLREVRTPRSSAASRPARATLWPAKRARCLPAGRVSRSPATNLEAEIASGKRARPRGDPRAHVQRPRSGPRGGPSQAGRRPARHRLARRRSALIDSALEPGSP